MSQKVQTDEFPPRKATPVVKSDATVIQCRGLYVGSGGDLVVELADAPGVVVTYKNAPVGYHPGYFTKVRAATTAGDILALV